MAGLVPERQEKEFIKAITKAVQANGKNPITIIAGKTEINGVIGAEKFSGRQATGSEPYTDVVLLVLERGKQVKYNLSLKGTQAASLAGGGLRGLELIIPGIAKKFMDTAYKYLIEDVKLKSGDKVPDVYGKIGSAYKLKIVRGTLAMGGPIDYMYIGDMNVSSKYDAKKNRLLFSNGMLSLVEDYSRTHELYFRLRARRIDQRFDPAAKDATNTPKIYGKSPGRGDSAGRIVITDEVPTQANKVTIS